MDEVEHKYLEYSDEIERLQRLSEAGQGTWFYAVRIKVLIYIRDRYFGPQRYSEPVFPASLPAPPRSYYSETPVPEACGPRSVYHLGPLLESIHEVAMERNDRKGGVWIEGFAHQ